MLDELAWVSLVAAGVGALLGSILAIAGWVTNPAVIAWGVPATLLLTGVIELALARRVRDATNLLGQLGAVVWLAHCVVLMLLSPPLIAFTLTAIGLMVGTIIGTTSAPPGAWRWGPIATAVWLLTMVVYLQSHDITFATIPPLVAFPSVFICGTAALVAGFTHRLELSKLAMNEAMEDLALRKAEAERANHAKSAFLASMSHELRTPLNAIIGYGELVLETTDDPETLEDVERITHAGRHLLSLVNDVLDTAKIEAGRMELREAAYAPVELLEEVHEVAEGLSAANGNELLWRVDALPESVLGDAIRVRQVVLNLLGNALKFTEGGRVELHAREVAAGWAVTVTDTGPGIDDETLAQLFVPFAQGRKQGMKAEGTGLGLSISKTLVDAMGGTLTVTTTVGEGSSFELTLPRSNQP